jgi:hypothetical protein
LRIPDIVFEPLHCVRLTGSSLTIGKDGGVVSLENRYDALLGCILIDKLLRGPFIVYIIESERLPNTEVLVEIHVFLPFLFSYLRSQVLHDAARLVLGPNVDDRSKLTAGDSFSR